MGGGAGPVRFFGSQSLATLGSLTVGALTECTECSQCTTTETPTCDDYVPYLITRGITPSSSALATDRGNADVAATPDLSRWRVSYRLPLTWREPNHNCRICMTWTSQFKIPDLSAPQSTRRSSFIRRARISHETTVPCISWHGKGTPQQLQWA